MSKRDYGIDLLRIISMILVVMTHTLNRGGIMANIPVLSFSYFPVCFIDIISRTAVDCFAIISGIVMYKKTQQNRKIISLWLIAFTYSVLFFVFTSIYRQSFSFGQLINSVFPVLSGKWWYLSAYFGAYFLFPYLSRLIINLSNKESKIFLLVLFFLFSVSQIIKPLAIKTYYFVGGYNVVWLLVLYSIGAIIKKLDLISKISSKFAAMCMLLSISVTYLYKILFEYFKPLGIKDYFDADTLSEYTSPTMVMFAIFATIFFAKIKIRSINLQKIVLLLSLSSFSVYLIQEMVYQNDMFVFVTRCSFLVMILLIIAIPLGVYIICTLIDYLRIKLFTCVKLEEKCYYLLDSIKALFKRFQICK